MQTTLKLIKGKKAMIGTAIGLVISFLSLKQVIDTDTAVFLNTLNAVFFFGASIATRQVLPKQN